MLLDNEPDFTKVGGIAGLEAGDRSRNPVIPKIGDSANFALGGDNPHETLME